MPTSVRRRDGVTAAERNVRSHCPKATIVDWNQDRLIRFVVTYDGVEYAGSGSTAAKAWADAECNLGLMPAPRGMR